MERVLFAHRQRDVHAANGVEEAGIVQVRQIMVGVDEIDVLLIVPIEQVCERAEGPGKVISSAECYDLAE
jgi:hypothetical protein